MAVSRRLATEGRFVSFVIRHIRRETGRSNGAAERRKSSRRLRPRCQGRDLVNRFIRSTMQWVSLRSSSAIKRARRSAETSRHKERYFATPSPLLLTFFPALYTHARLLHCGNRLSFSLSLFRSPRPKPPSVSRFFSSFTCLKSYLLLLLLLFLIVSCFSF